MICCRWASTLDLLDLPKQVTRQKGGKFRLYHAALVTAPRPPTGALLTSYLHSRNHFPFSSCQRIDGFREGIIIKGSGNFQNSKSALFYDYFKKGPEKVDVASWHNGGNRL